MQPLAPSDPQRIGPFGLLARLGAGGMGAVYLGQSSGGRRVAIKVIHDHLANDPGFRMRFTREVAAARQVGGLYTAQVVDADTEAAMPWMATRFVEGPSLSAHVARSGPLSPQEVKVLAAGVAEALVSIHAQGLIHRDLKPGNVLLSPDGPQVIDFGIAVDREATSFTSTGVLLGTFEFISPEQVQNRPVTPAADVFALGGLLCYAATGAPPFGSAHPAIMIARVVDANPDLSRVTDPELRDLVATCLAKRPERRPTPQQIVQATAGARSATRLPFTSSTPAPSELPATSGPAGQASPVRRRVVLGGAAVAAVTALGGGTWFALGRGGEQPRDDGPAHLDLPPHADGVRAAALSPDGATAVVGFIGGLAQLYRVSDGQVLRTLQGHRDAVAAAAFSPDGSRVATGSMDGTVIFWDVASGTAQRTIPSYSNGIDGIAFSRDGARLLAVTVSEKVMVWTVATGKLEHTLVGATASDSVAGAGFSPDGTRIATTALAGPTVLWDAATGRRITALDDAAGGRGTAYSPDGTQLAVGCSDHLIRVYPAAGGRAVATLAGHQKVPHAVLWTPDGTGLVSTAGPEVRFWDLAARRTTATVPLPDRALGLALSADGSTLLTGTLTGDVALWRTSDRQRLRALAPVAAKVLGLAVSGDGSRIATGAADGTVRLWTSSGSLLKAVQMPNEATRQGTARDRVNALALAPDGGGYAVGFDNGRVAFFTMDGTMRWVGLAEANRIVSGVADVKVLADGSVVVATNGTTVQHWSATGARLSAYDITPESPVSVEVLPGGKQTVAFRSKGMVEVRDLAGGRVVRSWRAHTAAPVDLGLSADGALLVTGGGDHAVKVWKVADGSSVRVLGSLGADVDAVAISPDGTRVAAGLDDKRVRVWNVADGAVVADLAAGAEVHALAFLRDAHTLVTAAYDTGTVRTWRLDG